VQCKACSEKADLVRKVEETYDLPVVSGQANQAEESPGMDDKEKSTEDVIKNLQKQFGENAFKVFKPGDFKDLSPEQMAEKFKQDL